jgi:GT2 family glycosyltransferase
MTGDAGDTADSAAGATPVATGIAVVIVTYHSGGVLPHCLEALIAQTRRPDAIVIVDNSFPDSGYLDTATRAAIAAGLSITLLRNTENLGFCAGNNAGYAAAGLRRYVLFLNPDAFLAADFLERAEQWMDQPENREVAILTGTLLKFDLERHAPSGTIDSTGIFQSWYGKWYDRNQGAPCTHSAARSAESVGAAAESVPAVCGALMFCRRAALETVVSPGTRAVFDEDFFMYKEDIDLSLRLRRKGWRLSHRADLTCFHGRGWRGRREMSARARRLSARNELIICFRNGGKGLLYSALKFLFIPFESALIQAGKRLRRRRSHRNRSRLPHA